MFTVQITTKSPLMLGSGTGRGSFIDADITVDENGLPMFPGKRLKGLLKESAVEVLEMLEQSGMHGFFDKNIIEIVFGTSTSPAGIKIGNLYLTDEQNTTYPDIKRWLQYLIHENNHRFINKEMVVNALTEIRQQTAINEDGYAEDNSLRTVRVLRIGKKFIGTIECSSKDLKEQIEVLLALACSNLKHAGSGRNRGWGEIECRLYFGVKQDLVKHAIARLRNWKESEKLFCLSNGKNDCAIEVPGQISNCPDGNPEDKYMLKYRITNSSPLLFTSPDGDENMVNTFDYIPGTALLGYYANRFIRIKGLEPATAQEDKHFKSWFVDGNLLFSNAYPFLEEYNLPLYPTPYFIHTDKQGINVYNLLDEECEETKALGGYCTIIGDEICAQEPLIMAKVAEKLNNSRADIIDINMGCPTPKITKNGEGCALMLDINLAGRIIRDVASASAKPVTVKLRKGWDLSRVNVVELARVAEENGAKAVAVHGRTRDMFYSGKADWDIIARVKEAVSIPVIGNGDVFTPQDAKEMLESTKCDAIMIGRGAQGNPWIFKSVLHYLKTGDILPGPSNKEKLNMIACHMDMLIGQKGEAGGVREMRKHIAWYIKGMRNANRVKQEIFRLTSWREIINVLKVYLIEETSKETSEETRGVIGI
jgi:tRNA-dihydrouridine synthase B